MESCCRLAASPDHTTCLSTYMPPVSSYPSQSSAWVRIALFEVASVVSDALDEGEYKVGCRTGNWCQHFVVLADGVNARFVYLLSMPQCLCYRRWQTRWPAGSCKRPALR